MKLKRRNLYLKLNLILGCFFVFAILVNIFPKFERNSMVSQDLETTTVQSTEIFEFQYFSDYSYDLTMTNQDKYLLSTTHDAMYCYQWGEACAFTGYIGGALQYIDTDYSVLWTIGGFSGLNQGIEFEDIQFVPYSADRLTDGTVIAVGYSRETTSNIYNITLLLIDEDGNPVHYQHIDLKGMGYRNSGHATYEILHTENGGFAVQVSETTVGTLLIQYDSLFTETWQIILEDTSNNDTDNFLQSIYAIGDHFYILIGDNITAISEDGSILWSKTYDFSITGFDITNDGDIVVSGVSIVPYKTMISLISFSSANQTFLGYEIGVIQSIDGSFKWKNTYHALRNPLNIHSLIRHTVQDEIGNYYSIIQNVEYDAYDTNYIILKHSSSGKYIGQSAFSDVFPSRFEISEFQYHFYKIDVEIDQEELLIYIPNFLKMKSIHFNEIEWNSSSPVPFRLPFYHVILYIRIWTNRFLIGFVALSIIYGVIMLIGKEDGLMNYCEDPEV